MGAILTQSFLQVPNLKVSTGEYYLRMGIMYLWIAINHVALNQTVNLSWILSNWLMGTDFGFNLLYTMVGIGSRKCLNECIPFGCVSLWNQIKQHKACITFDLWITDQKNETTRWAEVHFTQNPTSSGWLQSLLILRRFCTIKKRDEIKYVWLIPSSNGLCYAKRSLMSWVVVIPKEGQPRGAAPNLLLVWHRLFRFFFFFFEKNDFL